MDQQKKEIAEFDEWWEQQTQRDRRGYPTFTVAWGTSRTELQQLYAEHRKSRHAIELHLELKVDEADIDLLGAQLAHYQTAILNWLDAFPITQRRPAARIWRLGGDKGDDIEIEHGPELSRPDEVIWALVFKLPVDVRTPRDFLGEPAP